MASSWGPAWDQAWGDSWGVVASAVTSTGPKGGRRITKYEPIDARRARAQAAKRALDEERRRLATLKKQQTKVEVQYKAIALPETPAVPVVQSDRSRILELELKEFVERIALQNARVRALRKESELAEREAIERESDAEAAMEAHRAQQAQSEWERLEAEDDEMQQMLLLIHEDL